MNRHRQIADTITHLVWDNFLKTEPALTLRDIIAVELEKSEDRATESERERCAKIADDEAAACGEHYGNGYPAKTAREISARIRNQR